MRKVKVKICGITRKEDLSIAVDAGADAVGFVVGVPSSPRNLPLIQAETLIKFVPIFVKSVLVTVPRNLTELLKTCKQLNPNVIQLHGEMLFNTCNLRKELPSRSFIRGINANPINAFETAVQTATVFDAVLLDSFVQGKLGGTGFVHDWEMSKRIKHAIYPKPLILAGGLDPNNVRNAVSLVQPYAVDVSSGVELQPGIKNFRKVIEFIENAKDVTL
jgi:phosphoribosylanthranilate isomerase